MPGDKRPGRETQVSNFQFQVSSLYTYSWVDSVWTETVTRVHELEPDPVSMKTTRRSTVQGRAGHRLAERTELLTALGVWEQIDGVAYGYDDLDRLASETESTGASRTYGYDLAGNRLFKTETGSATIAYSLGVGDRLATYTGGSYTHNAAGCATSIDRTGKPDLDLTWNGQYQLTSVSTNGVVAESYAYDPLGRRASTTSGGVTIRHVYDGVHCAADIDSAGAVVRSYTWGPGIDNLLAVTCHSGSSSTTYYALTDIQGTVHGFADAGGNLVARYAYDAWGNLLDADVAVSDLADNRFLFQGREYSWATGLYNFRARWYDPTTGRWLSKDPIGISGGLNLYVFCANDPVNYVDPLGLCEESGIGFWDGVQGALDAGGIFEPTPFCDLSSAVISAFRGNWSDAKWSVLGVVPYVGDLGKVGKYGGKAAKYADKFKDLDNAVDNLDTIRDAQQKIRKGKLDGKIIDSTQKSEDAVKHKLDELWR